LNFILCQCVELSAWVQPCLPKDILHTAIPQTREALLSRQDCLKRQFLYFFRSYQLPKIGFIKCSTEWGGLA
jgi:tRNA U38,U39,U40 pseudouridine synthase TruA